MVNGNYILRTITESFAIHKSFAVQILQKSVELLYLREHFTHSTNIYVQFFFPNISTNNKRMRHGTVAYFETLNSPFWLGR